MPATSIATAQRYRALGNLKMVFVPTIAASNMNPTRAEIDAGDDVTREVAELPEFNVSTEKIETPDLNSQFVSSIPGAITADDVSVTFYDDLNGSDLKAIFPRDQVGYMLMMDQGDVATKKMDVFPVQVAALTKVRSMDNATMLRVDLTVTREPAEDVVLPAHV